MANSMYSPIDESGNMFNNNNFCDSPNNLLMYNNPLLSQTAPLASPQLQPDTPALNLDNALLTAAQTVEYRDYCLANGMDLNAFIPPSQNTLNNFTNSSPHSTIYSPVMLSPDMPPAGMDVDPKPTAKTDKPKRKFDKTIEEDGGDDAPP